MRPWARRRAAYLAGPHAGAARPSARRSPMRLAISMAVMAASPPLLPTLPPARSSACADCVGSGRAGVMGAVPRVAKAKASGRGCCCFARVCVCERPSQERRVHATPRVSPPSAAAARHNLLHGVAGEHAKHGGHAGVDARVEHAAGGRAHHGVVVRRRAAHLRRARATRRVGGCRRGAACLPPPPLTPAPAKGPRPSPAICSACWPPSNRGRAGRSIRRRRGARQGVRALAGPTTTPMQMTASNLPLLAMALATTGSSKLPGTQHTCRTARGRGG